MCRWVFAVSASRLLRVLLTGRLLKTSLLLWHFSPQHASLAMCDISPGVGVMANSGPDSQETRPRWRRSNNTVTSHNATALHYQTLVRLPSDCFYRFLPSSLHPPTLSNAVQRISPTFPHSPSRAAASLSKRDWARSKVASVILRRPSASDIISNCTSPCEFIYSVLSHVLTIRRLVECWDDILLYCSECICRVMVEMLLSLPAQMMARHCSLISAQHVLISMNV